MFISELINYPIGVYTFFGVPGCGKTTFAAAIAKVAMKKGIPVYSNVPIIGTYILGKENIGHYNLPLFDCPYCIMILDEAGIEYDNRNFKKNFDFESLQWWRLHRHYKCLVFCFSQGFGDLDLKIRNLTQQYFLIKRGLIFTYSTPIYYETGVNEEKHEMQDLYFYDPSKFFKFLKRTYIIGRHYWDLFDSYDAPKLPDLPLKKYVSKKAYEDVKVAIVEDVKIDSVENVKVDFLNENIS